MRTVALYMMLLGATILVLGVLGYAEAASIESIATGIVSGLLLVLAGLSMQKGSRPALYTTLIVSLALALASIYLLVARDVPFYPSGLIAILTGIAVILDVLLLVQPKERERLF